MVADKRELIRVLIEEPDAGRRARAHKELARRAVAGQRFDRALSHYREAAALDPADGSIRDRIEILREQMAASRRPRRKRDRIRAMLSFARS